METITCPYCETISTVEHPNIQQKDIEFDEKDRPDLNTYDKIPLLARIIVFQCQNMSCKKYTVKCQLLELMDVEPDYSDQPYIYFVKSHYQLQPKYAGITLPNYIPQSIRTDYEEAYLIKDLSPKASATLSRRCLQSMIKDYWKITQGTLVQQIKAIKNKVSASSWRAIDSVRHIGNIGAHMNREKGTDEILDVEPQEAEALLKLIELLFEDWYIAAHKRAEIEARAIELATNKGWKEKKDNEN